jgi:hypothetical protein
MVKKDSGKGSKGLFSALKKLTMLVVADTYQECRRKVCRWRANPLNSCRGIGP